jgi:hypothetical protein
VTVSEAVRLLGKTERTIRRWVDTGAIPADATITPLRVDIAGRLPPQEEAERPAESPPAPDVAMLLQKVECLEQRLQHDRRTRLPAPGARAITDTATPGHRATCAALGAGPGSESDKEPSVDPFVLVGLLLVGLGGLFVIGGLKVRRDGNAGCGLPVVVLGILAGVYGCGLLYVLLTRNLPPDTQIGAPPPSWWPWQK